MLYTEGTKPITESPIPLFFLFLLEANLHG